MSDYQQLDSDGGYTPIEEDALEPRDRWILVGITQGRTDKEIADEVQASVPVVKKRLRRMFRLSGIRTRAGLVWRYQKILRHTIKAGGKSSV